MGPIRRRFDHFLANPSSVRYAVATIISATVLVVVLGAVVVSVFDRKEYPTFGSALWFALQTVTTVGYGDVAPTEPVGRIVASLVMLTGIGMITVITAAVTSTFVAAATRRETGTREVTSDEARAALEEMTQRLDRIEAALRLRSDSPTNDQVDD